MFDALPSPIVDNAPTGAAETPAEYDLTIEETGKGLYRATFKGEVVVTDSSEPALAACRYLEAKGLDGILKVYGTNGKHRFTVDIRKGAKLTVKGSQFQVYKPR